MDGMNMTGSFVDVAGIDEIPPRGARTIATDHGDIALFRTSDDNVFALRDRCPHKAGPLSQGIVHGHAVTCPLHAWVISLADGTAAGEDAPCVPRYATRVEAGRVLLDIGGPIAAPIAAR